MNRRCALCVFVLLFPLTLFSKTPEKRLRPFVPLLIEKARTITAADWRLSVEPAVGMTYGELGEYVYSRNANDEVYKKLSYLQWQEHPLWTVGATVLGCCQRLNARLFLGTALPIRCGDMEDSDWMNLDSMKTTYSISENTMQFAFNAEFALSYDFFPTAWLRLSPVAELAYAYRNFSAKNGYGWYGQNQNPYVSWDDPEATYFGAGQLCGIDYTRYSVAAYIGGTVDFTVQNRLHVIVSGAVSPFTYVESLDTHWRNFSKTNSNDYLDIESSMFTRVKGSVAVYYAITPALDIGITCSALAGFFVYGTTYTKKSDGKFYEQDSAKSGADIYEANVRISCRIHCL